jgi:hypothetical protein
MRILQAAKALHAPAERQHISAIKHVDFSIKPGLGLIRHRGLSLQRTKCAAARRERRIGGPENSGRTSLSVKSVS